MQVPYWSVFRALGGVHLEASRIMAVASGPGQLVFDLVVVLSPSHPLYRGPRQGDEHDLRTARLSLAADRIDTELAEEATSPVAQDLGPISSWLVDGNGWSDLVGRWGSARAFRPTVTLTFETEAAGG